MKSFPNVNVNWLMFGTGGMFNAGENDNNVNASQNKNEAPHGVQKRDDKMAVEPSLFDVPTTTQNGYQTKRNDTQRSAQLNSEASISGAKLPSPTIQQVVVEKSVSRKITEIRIFYDDQTWESFLPKK
jgi:hypothetical protein